MKSWIISLGCIIIISALITMLLPEGKLGKFIKYYFSLIIMIVIIQPISKINNYNLNYDSIFNEKQINIQLDYLEYVTEKRINNHILDCKKIAENLGIRDVLIDINYNIDEKGEIILNKVYINLKNSVIISDKAHINIIVELKDSICDYLAIEEEQVVIYE